MRIAVILGSARGDGNTAKVLGGLQQYLDFYLVNLLEYDIHYYDYDHGYLDDDFINIIERLVDDFDVLIYATPVYWYTMSAQLKTFIDRHSDLVRVRKDLGRKLQGKTMAVISCGHSNDLVEGFDLPFQHTAKYLNMNYFKNLYAWHDGSVDLQPEVKQRLADFAQELKTLMP